MSVSIQACLWDRRTLPNYSPPRPGKEMAQRDFVRTVYGDPYFLKRMDLYKELKGHQGCVNTLHWSQQGDKLLSGSDDHSLRIWYPFEEDHEMNMEFKTGHRDNIFDAKFMPSTNDQFVISVAGDSEVRIFNLDALSSTNRLHHIYTCHSDPVKRICTEAYNPYEFLTCSEDATVRHFDLRQPHICSPHSIRSFNSGIPRHARQYTSQHRVVSPRPLREGCPRPLLDYSRYGFDINCMAINLHRPQYLAIAGMDDYIYLHDRRMIPSSDRDYAGKTMDRSPGSQCILRFTPSDNQLRNQTRQYVTSCKFSDSNGYELLGNWAGNGVYLFNILDSPGDLNLWETSLAQPYDEELRHCLQLEKQTSRPNPVSLSTSPIAPASPLPPLDNDPMIISDDDSAMDDDTLTPVAPPSPARMAVTNREQVIQALVEGDLPQSLDLLSQLYIYLQHGGGGNESSLDSQSPRQQETTRLEHTWLHCVTAIVFATRSVRTINKYKAQGLSKVNYDGLARDDLKAAQVEILRATEIAPNNWKGQWCLAITHWIIYCRSDRCSALMMQSPTKDSAFFLTLLCHHLQKTKKYSIGVMKLLAELIFSDKMDQHSKRNNVELLIKFYVTMFGLVCLMKVECKSFSISMEGYYDDLMARLSNDTPTSSTAPSPSSEEASSPSSSPSPSSTETSSESDPAPSALVSAIDHPVNWLRLLYPAASSLLTATSAAILYDSNDIYGEDDDDRFIIDTAKFYLKNLGTYNLLDTKNGSDGNDDGDDDDDDDEYDDDEDEGGSDQIDFEVDRMEDEGDSISNETDNGDDDDDNDNEDSSDDDSDNDNDNHIDNDDDDDNDDDSDEDRIAYLMLAMYGRTADREYAIDVQPSDMECHQRSIRREFESNAGVIGHRSKYTGHMNTRTIKGVNFYGAQDEYVVSGSDDGRAFIWNKKTGAIVQILEADHDTVNVIQGHPFLPYLAISGIDNTIKIFSPNAPHSSAYGSLSSMDQRDQIVANNRETMEEEILEPFMTRSALENMARLYRQHYSNWLTSVDD